MSESVELSHWSSASDCARFQHVVGQRVTSLTMDDGDHNGACFIFTLEDGTELGIQWYGGDGNAWMDIPDPTTPTADDRPA